MTCVAMSSYERQRCERGLCSREKTASRFNQGSTEISARQAPHRFLAKEEKANVREKQSQRWKKKIRDRELRCGIVSFPSLRGSGNMV